MQDFIEEQTFTQIDYTQEPLDKAEYEDCTFSNCDFSSSDLADVVFSNCRFISCNLSMVRLSNTVLRDVKFKECKLLGIDFEVCNPFGLKMIMENCILNHCLFFKTKIRKTTFKDCHLHEADFTECDLTSTVFENCDLTRATFERTILEKADFRTAYGFIIDPELNRIKKALFSIENISGLLTKYDIHIER